MTETSTAETAPPQQAASDGNGAIHPADILLHLIVTLLVPMFLAASDGNLYYAHMAALETVTAYRTRNHVDLVAVAQILAFGFAALGSLSLSFTDDLSLPMILRLRGNANACSGSAERNRRALNESRAARQQRNETGAADSSAEPPYDSAYEAAMIAGVAQAQREVAMAQAQMTQAEPETVPASAAPAAPDVAAPATMPAPIPCPIAVPATITAPASVAVSVAPAAAVLNPAATTASIAAPATIPGPRLGPLPGSIAVPTAITASAGVAAPIPAAIAGPNPITASAALVAPAPITASAGTHRTPAISSAAVSTRASAATPARFAAAPIGASERQVQAMWAAAMGDVADEFTASIPHLPKAERWKPSRRAAALSSCATDLLSCAIPPPARPADPGRIMRPNAV